MSIGVVWNRAARRARYLPVQRLFPDAEVRVPESLKEAEGAARELAGRYETVVAVGGDGTVNAVVNGIFNSGASLALLPAGTGNLLAHELGIPVHEPRKAAQIALGNDVVAIDVGCCGDRLFVASVGFGVDAEVVRRADAWKPVFGRMAFVLAATAEQFRTHRWKVRVSDGREVLYEGEAVLAAAVNCPKYAGWRSPTSEASLTDGLLDLFVLRPIRLPGTPLVDVAALACLGLLRFSSRVSTFRRKEFRLHFEGEIPWCQMDGELLSVPAETLLVVPGALQVKARKHLM